jgi:hypothetical protein
MVTVDDLLGHFRQARESPLYPFGPLSEIEARARIHEIAHEAR